MTAKLRSLFLLEEAFLTVATEEITFGRPRFTVRTKLTQTAPFESYEATKAYFDSMTVGEEGEEADVRVFFIHHDGSQEDFTEFFPLSSMPQQPLTKEQERSIMVQGKELVNLLKPFRS